MTATKKKIQNNKKATVKKSETGANDEKNKPNSPSVDTSKDPENEADTAEDSGTAGTTAGGAGDVFKKVTEWVEVPGAGKIPVKLIEVEFGGVKHRERTRREATFWLRAQRKAAAKKERQTKEIERMAKDVERAEKVAGYLVGQLETMSCKISTLCRSTVLTDEQRVKITEAAKLLQDVASERKEQEAKKAEK